jgi:hypothetical protein
MSEAGSSAGEGLLPPRRARWLVVLSMGAAALGVGLVGIGALTDTSPAPGFAGRAGNVMMSVRRVAASAAISPECPATPTVWTTAQLNLALSTATPGTTIVLAPNTTYVAASTANFVISRSGTASAPIQLCGPATAVMSGKSGPLSGHPVLGVTSASYWTISGMTITNGLKGIMLDTSDHVVLDGVSVTTVGNEAIHLRTNSTDNIVRNCIVRLTGLRDPQYGEGIYVGSAKSNWGQYTGGDPDRSDRNLVEGNDIAQTTAEPVDIKEGTTGGTLQGNMLNASGITSADSWMDVKGNGWQVTNNQLVCGASGCPTAAVDGIQTHILVAGWGDANVLSGNNSTAGASGFGINIQTSGSAGQARNNVVHCDNLFPNFTRGMSNTTCQS